MSIRINELKSQSRENKIHRIMDEEIESTWSYFMTALDYEQYYRDNFKNFNGKTNLAIAESKLKKLFETLHIRESDNNLYSCHNNILSNCKIWIMYILLVYNEMTINETLQIFLNSLKYNIDKVFMFEFYVIFCSKLDYNSLNIMVENIPNEFRLIYYNNRKLLFQLFDNHDSFNDSLFKINSTTAQTYCKDFSFNYELNDDKVDLDNTNEEKLKNIFDDMNFSSDELIEKTKLIEKSPATINKISSFSESCMNKSSSLDNYLVVNKIDKYEDNDIDLERYIINICENVNLGLYENDLVLYNSNFNNNHNFAIFCLKNRLKKKLDSNHMITPLKIVFNSFEEKMLVQKDLNEIKQLYMNYIYFPFNLNLTQLIKNN